MPEPKASFRLRLSEGEFMGRPYADPRMLELNRKHQKHFKHRKREEAINVAKTLANNGIEIDEDSGGNIQVVELTPKGWQWLAKP